MKKFTLLGAAALALGLTCQVSAQKKVEYLGPPVNEKGVPKGGARGKPKESKPQEAQPQSGPQSGQAVGFGVGKPGASSPGTPTHPPLVNPPDTIKPPEGEPESNVKPVKNPAQAAEVDRPVGTPAKKLTPRKKIRARRVKKG